MASLSEAYGCNLSENFELIDDNFKLDSDEVLAKAPETVETVEGENVHECDKLQLHLMRCQSCKELRYHKDMTNILLLFVIGLLLFTIVEKRVNRSF